MLIEAGAKPVDVAARLGHVNPTITQNLYTHDTEEMQRETIAIFSRMVYKQVRRQTVDKSQVEPQ